MVPLRLRDASPGPTDPVRTNEPVNTPMSVTAVMLRVPLKLPGVVSVRVSTRLVTENVPLSSGSVQDDSVTGTGLLAS